MENFTKISKEMLSELPVNISSMLQRTSLINSKLRLEELITISIKRSNKGMSNFKKMLHVPGIQLYGLKEVPIKSPEMRKNLKEWISVWQSLFQDSGNGLVKVLGTFWNCPEGNLSILMELMNAGSLQGLLENVGGLHEGVICRVARRIIEGMKIIHENGRYYEGTLTTEQILLDRDANVKISLGLSTNLEANTVNSQNSHAFWLQNTIFNQNLTKETVRKAQNNDLYNIGLICLMAAVGDSGLLGYSDEEVEKINKETTSLTKKGYCCILHSEKTIVNRKIGLLEILEKRGLSQEFIGFLCHALRFNWQERGNLGSLLDRLKSCHKTQKDEPLNLRELIKVGLFWENHHENDEKTGIKFLEKILESMKVVMPNCENWFLKEEYKSYLVHLQNFNEDNDVFKNLEKELGVRREVIYEKMKLIFKEFGFIRKEGE